MIRTGITETERLHPPRGIKITIETANTSSVHVSLFMFKLMQRLMVWCFHQGRFEVATLLIIYFIGMTVCQRGDDR